MPVLTGFLDAQLERQLKKALSVNVTVEEELQKWKKRYFDSTSNVDELRRADDVQTMTILELRDEVVDLRRQLARKDRETADASRRLADADRTVARLQEAERARSERDAAVATQVAALRHQVAVANDKEMKLLNKVQQADVAKTAADQKDATLMIVVRSLREQLAEETRARQALVEKLQLQERVRSAEAAEDAGKGTAELRALIEELRGELVGLREQNDALVIERERYAWLHPSSGEAAAQPATVSQQQQQIDPALITPRTSSAVDLVDSLPEGGDLKVQFMKSKIAAMKDAEMKRLREENMALVNQLAATLNNIAKMR
ncbi:hypothetical protein HK405_013769 [Cladochytrium tenue]|nr:hypothetical protein HK405_013769 [Cladochytrium tenue]